MAEKTGTVKWFSARKRSGVLSVIEADKINFVHFSEIQTRAFRKLKPGQKVTFEDRRPARAGSLQK